jgi:hypothetical protein
MGGPGMMVSPHGGVMTLWFRQMGVIQEVAVEQEA